MGFTTYEGLQVVGETFYNKASSPGNAATGFKVALFSNATGNLTINSTVANLTKPTGGSYADVTVAASGWTVSSSGSVTRSAVTFTATGGAFGTVNGAAVIATTPTGEYLLHVDYRDGGGVTVATGDSYQVDLSQILSPT